MLKLQWRGFVTICLIREGKRTIDFLPILPSPKAYGKVIPVVLAKMLQHSFWNSSKLFPLTYGVRQG